MKCEEFGKLPDGRVVTKYFLANENGVEITLMDYGATLLEVKFPDKYGRSDDILLGFDSLEGYLTHAYFGATIGRFANRICKGMFSLDGVEYNLATNNGENHLHGGNVGFDKKIWEATDIEDGVRFSLVSEDMDEGYPGQLHVTVDYTLEEDLKMVFQARVNDKTTVVNLTNHAFINLAGQDSGVTDCCNHLLTINAPSYLPHKNLIPTGEIKSVDEAFDFTKPKPIGQDIDNVDGGYDHNFCLQSDETFCARVLHVTSGRQLEIITDQPGVQFYSGNFLDMQGKSGNYYAPRAGFCLEPQGYPDNPNQDQFPSSTLRPGDIYQKYITWKFSIVGR